MYYGGPIDLMDSPTTSGSEVFPEPACKICFETHKNDTRLLSKVCNCKGTLGYVHGSCLLKWHLFRAKACRKDFLQCDLCQAHVAWPEDMKEAYVNLVVACQRAKSANAQSYRAAQRLERPMPTQPARRGPSRWGFLKRGLSVAVNILVHPNEPR